MDKYEGEMSLEEEEGLQGFGDDSKETTVTEDENKESEEEEKVTDDDDDKEAEEATGEEVPGLPRCNTILNQPPSIPASYPHIADERTPLLRPSSSLTGLVDNVIYFPIRYFVKLNASLIVLEVTVKS